MKIVTSSGGRNFKIIRGNEEILVLKHQSWSSGKACARYHKQEIEIKSTCIWRREFIILKNGLELGAIIFDWQGQVMLDLDSEAGKTYRYFMKPKGFWKLRFEVHNEIGDLVLTLYLVSKRHKANPDYEIVKTSNEPPFDEHEFLLYCGYMANALVGDMVAV